MKVVIIGGVAGGAACAARLRRLDEAAEITMLEKGEFISYANCGLPYYIGGDITRREKLIANTPDAFRKKYRVDVRTACKAVGVDTEKKLVHVANMDEPSGGDIPYDVLVLAPGARPVVPPLQGVEDERVFSLRTIPDTFAIREYLDSRDVRRAVVVGGGYIGVEMADVLARRGIAVTLLERAPAILPTLDEEMAESVEDALREEGIQIYTGCTVKAFRRGGTALTVQTASGDFAADMVILSTGVKPDTDFLQGSGIRRNEDGAILVDDCLRTSIPDVYAVGDAVAAKHLVTGEATTIALAGPANRQARIAADNICGLPSTYGGGQGSAIVKALEWTVASTGINERQAVAAGLCCDKVYITAASHAGYYPGATPMNIKLLFQTPSGRILGAQLVGREGVDKRCDVIATALHCGLSADRLAGLELCYAPPYSSTRDPVNVAGYVAGNVLRGTVKQYFWQDLQRLPRDGSVTLLDVRTTPEREAGSVPGTMHIPLEQLRERIGELDESKPVYVHCQSGMRSYMACRILAAHGFDCYNFAGGYNLYQSLLKKH